MYYTLVHIGEFLLLLNLILYLKGFSKQAKAYKIFAFYLILVGVIEVVSGTLKQLQHNNLFLSHFYFIGQFILLSVFYHSLLKDPLQKKLVKYGFVAGLLVISVQYIFEPSIFFKFNLFEIFVTALLLIVFAIFRLYNMLNEKKEFFYINMGLLIYLFGSTVLFFVGNLTADLSPKWSYFTWTFNAFLVIVNHCFILIEWKKNYSG
ncbi:MULTISPECIES: hypothetical protein [unclassified Flavobacterium]|uniref:hypothetical protein n=1 Tax=unclassified Flavobacterium TaxID=196869 RepID=UPI003F937977